MNPGVCSLPSGGTRPLCCLSVDVHGNFVSLRFSTRGNGADTICQVFFLPSHKGCSATLPLTDEIQFFLVFGHRDVGVGLAVIGPNPDGSFNSYTHSFRG